MQKFELVDLFPLYTPRSTTSHYILEKRTVATKQCKGNGIYLVPSVG